MVKAREECLWPRLGDPDPCALLVSNDTATVENRMEVPKIKVKTELSYGTAIPPPGKGLEETVAHLCSQLLYSQ